MKLILVTDLNNEEIARNIVYMLGKNEFDIVTDYFDSNGKFTDRKVMRKKTLSHMDPGSFTINNGLTRIPFLGSRAIIWDLKCEHVTVDFQGDGVIFLNRILKDNKTISRTILV